MTPKEAIKEFKVRITLIEKYGYVDSAPEFTEAMKMAVSALEFRENYDQFWEEVKSAGIRGEEVEIRGSGRIFRIREVAQ